METKHITLGCDPEVFLINRATGRFFESYKIIKGITKIGSGGEIASDGNLLEFRPQYSVHVEEVCRSIWNLILEARTVLNMKPEGRFLRMQPTSYHQQSGRSAGFHLHYGLWASQIVAKEMIRVLDYYVGITAIIPEGNHDSGRRVLWTDEGTVRWYGKPRDFKLDDKTLEYRVPGAANLAHPTLTAGLLAIGAVVVEDVVNKLNIYAASFERTRSGNLLLQENITNGSGIDLLYPNMPNSQEVKNVIVNEDASLAIQLFNSTIKNDIQKMAGYAFYKSAIDKYFSCLDNNQRFSNDLESNWKEVYNPKN